MEVLKFLRTLVRGDKTAFTGKTQIILRFTATHDFPDVSALIKEISTILTKFLVHFVTLYNQGHSDFCIREEESTVQKILHNTQ